MSNCCLIANCRTISDYAKLCQEFIVRRLLTISIFYKRSVSYPLSYKFQRYYSEFCHTLLAVCAISDSHEFRRSRCFQLIPMLDSPRQFLSVINTIL